MCNVARLLGDEFYRLNESPTVITHCFSSFNFFLPTSHFSVNVQQPPCIEISSYLPPYKDKMLLLVVFGMKSTFHRISI